MTEWMEEKVGTRIGIAEGDRDGGRTEAVTSTHTVR